MPKATKRKRPMKLMGETLIVKRNFDKWNAVKRKKWHFGVDGKGN